MTLITKISDLVIAIANDIKNLNANVNAFNGRVTTLEQTDSATDTRLQVLESNTGGSLTMQEVQQEIARWGVYRDVYAGSGWYKDANGRVYSKGVASGETKKFPNDLNTYINILDSDLTSIRLNTLISGKVKPMFATSNLTKLSFDQYGSEASILAKLYSYNTNDVSSWDVGHITNFDNAFAGMSNIIGLDKIDVSNMVSARKMLASASPHRDTPTYISKWKTSKLSNAESMFEGFTFRNTTADSGLSSLNTSSLTNAKNMLKMSDHSSAKILDLSGWDVSKLVNAEGMFLNMSITTANFIGLDDWRVGNVTNMANMFGGLAYPVFDLSNWCVSNISVQPAGFANIPAEKRPVWGTCPYMGYGWYKDPVTGIVECNGVADRETHQFDGDPKTYVCTYNDKSGNYFNDMTVENAATSNMTDMSNAFYNSNRMAGKNLSHLDLSNVTNMSGFARGSNFDGDLSNLHAPLIPYKPSGFLQGTPIANDVSKHPRWGA